MSAQEEADRLMRKADKKCLPSFMSLRFKPDWMSAAPLYQEALQKYKEAKNLKSAIEASEKAAHANEQLGSGWHAGKFYEEAADMAAQCGLWPQVAQYSQEAANQFFAAGKLAAGGETLGKGATLLEDKDSTSAMKLYSSALEAYEREEKGAQAGDLYSKAIGTALRHNKYADAVALFMRFAEAVSRRGLDDTLCKAYLGAIVVWLYAGDISAAWTTYQDCMSVESFANSDQAFAAEALFQSYSGGTAADVQKCVAKHSSLKFIDAHAARLARQLPKGDMSKLAATARELLGHGVELGHGAEDTDLDLT